MYNWLRSKKSELETKSLKKDLVIATDENINSIQSSIDDVCQILKDFKKNKYSKHDSFFNLCIFSDIVNIDLTILLEKIGIANRKQEKNLYARVMAVTIVDYLDNISVLIGRDCLLELRSNNMNEFVEEFKAIHKKYSSFKKNNEALLRNIRNNTIAHKSKDALKLNAQINNLDIDEIYRFGIELKKYSKEFVDLSTKIIYYIADYMKEGRIL